MKVDMEAVLASKLHLLLCHYNHADQCGWFIEVDKEGEGHAHKKYRRMAKQLIASPLVKSPLFSTDRRAKLFCSVIDEIRKL